MYEVITLGETMLRFTPVDGQRIEQAAQFDLHVGGSESNTAVGLARLGHRVAWLSRLTDNALGRKLAASIAAHGVDTQHILWTNQDRIGTYYFEPGSPPRSNQVIYDRCNSSFSRFSADMLPKELFASSTTNWLHITGISLALGATSQTMIARAIQLARDAGWKISFDVNYRAKLWSAEEAARVCRETIEKCDLVFMPIRDAIAIFKAGPEGKQVERDPVKAARPILEYLSGLTSAECIVLTLGEYGAAAHSRGQFDFQPTMPVEHPLGRLGGGDAFSSGFLSAWLETGQVELGLRRGNSAARLKYSIPGDLPYFTREEVLSLETDSNNESQYFR